MPQSLTFLGLVAGILASFASPASGNDRDGAEMPALHFFITWGQRGTPEFLGRYEQPLGITTYTDPFGEETIVVSDSGNHRIKFLSNVGGFNLQFGHEGSGEGEYRWPTGIAVDRHGSVFVADTLNDRVQKVRLWTSSLIEIAGTCEQVIGSRGSDPGQFRAPTGLALDREGNLYVLDSGNHRVQKFSNAGEYLTSWGREGSAPGEMIGPTGIAIDSDGAVYVTDSGNHRVQKFDSDGNLLRTWGSQGEGAGQLQDPRGIAITPEGVVIVANAGNDRLEFYNAEGEPLGQLGRTGLGNGEFRSPHGVACDKDGCVYVTEITTHRIQKFCPPLP
ncbi:6-bladed beta-propeller [Tautonia rosea]|uniref:6-bladed beta-propeller n=1 Tax=Tautonia rosea TaxID=2728037 RepID=UPI0014739DDD|nr:6-bladed beta-propeller [Tautonia rosea]